MAGLATDSVWTLPLFMPDPAVCWTIVALNKREEKYFEFFPTHSANQN
jgi:hypothetical protein